MVFDVPSLLGKNIDEVTAAIGPPTRDEQERRSDQASAPQYGLSDDEENFERQGVGLLVRYELSDKRVTQFFLVVHGADGNDMTTDTSSLLKAGNLRANDPHYMLEYVEAVGFPGQYLGVRVKPLIIPGMDKARFERFLVEREQLRKIEELRRQHPPKSLTPFEKFKQHVEEESRRINMPPCELIKLYRGAYPSDLVKSLAAEKGCSAEDYNYPSHD